MLNERAFVGVSLDSKDFNRAWVRFALKYLTGRHDHLMVVFADDLLKFTRTAVQKDDVVVVDFESIEPLVGRSRKQMWKYFEEEILRLPREKQKSVQLGNWSLFADAKFNELHRRLRIAYEVVPDFRAAVDDAAREHCTRQKVTILSKSTLANLNASYIIEECAMCIRITELEGYSAEYHPTDDLPVLPKLYAGTFANRGLSVHSIAGKQPRRTFTVLRRGEV